MEEKKEGSLLVVVDATPLSSQLPYDPDSMHQVKKIDDDSEWGGGKFKCKASRYDR